MDEFDPRSTLARAEAERRIVDMCMGRMVTVLADDTDGADAADTAELLLYELAYGHRLDIPGYRAEWRPLGLPD